MVVFTRAAPPQVVASDEACFHALEEWLEVEEAG